MRFGEVDGVPIAWAAGPGPLSASLLFGCGVRDESFPTLGLTHLVRRLAIGRAISAVPGVTADALTDLDVTMFTATGDPDGVAGFLLAVCAALNDLPPPTPANLIAGGDGRYEPERPEVAVLLDRRYGRAGLGLARWPTQPVDAFGPDQLRTHAATYFSSGNAAAYLTGPPPPDLRLPLRFGPPAGHDEPFPVRPGGPLWSAEWGARPSVILRADRGLRWDMLADLLGARLRRSGSVFTEFVDVNPLTREMIVGVDARSGREAAAVESLWRELQQVASAGPTERELAAVVDQRRAALTRVAHLPMLEGAALERVLGTPMRSIDDELAALDRVAPMAVIDAARQGLRTALFVAPPGTRPNLPGVAEDPCPRASVVPDGVSFGRARAGGLLGRRTEDRLILHGDAVTKVDPDGGAHTIRLTDAVVLEAEGDHRVIAGPDRCVVAVDPANYPGAEKIVAEIDRRRLRGGPSPSFSSTQRTTTGDSATPPR